MLFRSGEVRVGDTAHAETLRLAVLAVEDGLRVPDIAGLVENGDTVKVAVGIARERAAGIHVQLDVPGNRVIGIRPRLTYP